MAAMTWEQRGLRRKDGTLAAKPWSQAARRATWVQQYRDGLTFGQIATAAGVGTSIVRESVSSWFARQGIQRWRHASS